MSREVIIERIGPFSMGKPYRFSINGYMVPNLEGRLIDGENTWSLSFDNRFSIQASDQELENWLWFFANACAVSAGYTNFGEGSRPINRYSVRGASLGSVDEEDI